MNMAGRARQAVGVIMRHRVISSVIALFAVASIVVSVTTNDASAAKTYPAAPRFSLPALGKPSGTTISLSQYKGKPVIVNFWASWCEPCQKETPLIANWYKQQHGKVILLGLDEDDNAANALKFATAKGVTYPIAFDSTPAVTSSYGVSGLPQTFFLNAQHHIVYHIAGAITTSELNQGLSLMKSATSAH